MARAKKIGVDYYSHDVGAQKKQTVKALRSRFGNDGYAFWFILLELLGERDGLYMDCSDEATWIYLCTEVMIDEDKVTDMLNFLGRLGAIDKDLWAVDKIIWCQNFTDRLADVFKKRGVPKPEKPISKMVSATKTNISAPEMPISATEMRQSKVKESKVKNSKVNTTLEVDTTPVDNSDDGSVDGLDFDNNLIPKQEAGVSVMPVAEEEVMIDEDKVADMLNFLGRLGAIDKDLWAVDKIIWCQNFTDRLADVFKKRGVPKPEKPISKMVSATKTNISAPEMPISATEMRQSKVKESKVKNSKVNTTLEVDTTPVDNSDDGSVDGLDFDNNLIPKQEAGVSVMPVAEEVDCFWDVFKTVYPRKRGISVPMAKDALRKFLEYGGDQADLIAAAVKYGRIVAESKTEEQFMKTPHVFAGGYFKTFVPKYRRNCPACHGEGFVEGPDGNMVECCCVDRYKEWKA